MRAINELALRLLPLFFLITILLSHLNAYPETIKEVKIGVLAYRGKEEALRRWQPTADYLTLNIPDTRFTVIPLDFNEIGPATRDGKIDFVITNTSIYVELESAYGISRIATLKNRWKESGYTLFGGVIFTRADRDDIKDLKDLKGKTFMAVDETSLGGWRMAWREMKQRGINPYRDLKDLRFEPNHDRVVMAVLNREVDAGTVRTDIIERMADAGRIDIKDIRVINEQKVDGFPFLLSTRLYPEWPFARLEHVSEDLSEEVAIALLSMPHDSPAAIASESEGWTIPLDYHPVHELMKELRVGPYKDYGKVTIGAFVRQYWYVIFLTLLIIIVLLTLVIIITRLNRRLNESRLRLQHAMDGLEVLVQERTAELNEKNRALTLEIEKRKRTEGELIKAKTEWEQTFDAVPDIIAIIGPDRRIIRANRALIEKIGSNDITKKRCFELNCQIVGVQNFEPLQNPCPCQRMYETGKTEVSELYIEHLGGYYLVTASPIMDDKGNIVSCVHVARDITERKIRERLLMESEERFRKLAERSLVGIYIIQDGQFKYVNQKMADIFGYEPEELINKKTPYDLTEESYHPTVKENIRKRLEGEIETINYRFKGKKKDGSLIDVEAMGSVTDIDSRPAIVGTIIDITEQVQREEFREAQRRFLQSILDNIFDHIIVIRTDYSVEMANEPLRASIEKDTFCYRISHGREVPCDGSEHPCPLKEVIEKKEKIRTVHKHIYPDGERIMEIETSPVLNENGDVVFVIEASRDITERVRLEEEHRRLMQRLHQEEKEQSLMTLTGGIAHDFNNMLMAIMGNAEILRMRLKDEETPYLETIINTSEKMADLVSKMLAFTGQGAYQPSIVNLNDSIKNALKMTHKGQFLNIIVKLDLDDKLWPVLADGRQMEQLMVNLILNAFEAIGDENEGTLYIKTSNIEVREPMSCYPLEMYLKEGEYVEVKVTDTGMGIPKELHKRVFEPFFSTRFMGRGLGLSAVAGIVKSHNGCISLESEEGRGTTFTIHLPRASQTATQKKDSVTPIGILVVDDEEIILGLLKDALTSAGYNVYTAEDGLKALEIFRDMKDNIVLSIIDIEMPGMDGRRLISELRKISKDIRIIVSTGYDKETALTGIEPEPDAFIQKPYRLSVILNKVKELLR